MSFYELFKKGHQTRNKAHFASIASIAMSDGKISEDELTLLQAEFEKDYGTADVNIQDGVINYPKENGEADKKD